MNSQRQWHLERYRALLHLQARRLQLHPRIRRRLDSSDLVQEALLRAVRRLEGFAGQTEGELVRWLQTILSNVCKDQLELHTNEKRDVLREQDLQAAVDESNAGLDHFLSAPGSSPEERVERKELLLRIARALEQLPQDQRDAVTCRKLN